MSGAVTEEDVIRRDQHLDLVYSQSGTLYDIIPQPPRPSNDKSQPAPGPHVDGVIGHVSSSTIDQVVRQLVKLALADNLAPTALEMTSTTYSS